MKSRNHRTLAGIVSSGAVAALAVAGLGHERALERLHSPLALHRSVAQRMGLDGILKGLDKVMSLPSAHAGSWTYYDQVENDFYMLVGWPSQTVYNNMMSGGNGPPQSGMLGIAKQIVDGMASAASSNGISSCAAVPSSGSGFTAPMSGSSDTIAVAYATPTHSVPAGYTDAGTPYAKRVNLTVSDPTMGTIKVGLEWICDLGGGYAEFSLNATNPSTNDPTVRTINLFVDASNESDLQAEFMMTMVNTAAGVLAKGAVDDSQITRLQIDNTSKSFQIWTVNTYYRGSSGSYKYNGYRAGMNGVDGGTTSTYLDVAAASSSLLSGTLTDYTTDAPSAYDFSNGSWTWSAATLQGCLNFETQVDPTSTSLCSGQALTTPTAPLVDSSGAFDYTWVENTLPTKVTIGF